MSSCIRVLQLFGEPISNGGQESFVINVIKKMDTRKLKIDLLTPYYCDNKQYEELIKSKGGEIISLNLKFTSNTWRGNIIFPLIKYLRKHRYDIVHIHSGSITVLMLGSIISRICRVKKIIVHSHSGGIDKNISYRFIKCVSTPAMSLCPTDYCACSLVAGQWKFPKTVIKNKLHILKNGIDLENFVFNSNIRNRIRNQLNVSEETVLIGHVGRFNFPKNQKYILQILEKLLTKNQNYKVIFIGTGEDLEKNKMYAIDHHINDHVIFQGNVNNVNEYMQAMDIFVLPSYFEGLPIVGVEAQAAGLPTFVSSNVSKELKLTDDIIFLPLSDIDLWVDEISKVELTRYDNIKTLRNQGFDSQNTANVILSLYIGRNK